MASLSDTPITPPKIILYGEGGVGKTCFVATYGEGLQLIDCNRGLLSAKTLKDKWTAERHKIDVVSCYESDPKRATAWGILKKTVLQIYEDCLKGIYPHKVLAIDSLTDVAEYALRGICGNSGSLGQPEKVTQAQWGLAIAEVYNLFVYLRALPIPVVITAHTMIVTIGTGKDAVTRQVLSIYGKNLAPNLINLFDEVDYVKTRIVQGKPEPYLQTMKDAFVQAKTRSQLVDGTKLDIGFREYMKLLGWK